MEWRDLKSEVLAQKMQATKTGVRPPLKESMFSNVLAILVEKFITAVWCGR